MFGGAGRKGADPPLWTYSLCLLPQAVGQGHCLPQLREPLGHGGCLATAGKQLCAKGNGLLGAGGVTTWGNNRSLWFLQMVLGLVEPNLCQKSSQWQHPFPLRAVIYLIMENKDAVAPSRGSAGARATTPDLCQKEPREGCWCPLPARAAGFPTGEKHKIQGPCWWPCEGPCQ